MKKEKLTLLLMVKNEMKILPHILPNMVEAGIPICCLDTGSTDGTQDYLRQNDALVFEYEGWDYNFSKARNYLLEKVSSEWVLFLDADEYLTVDSYKQIIALIKDAKESYYKFPIYQCRINECNTQTIKNYRIKLWRTDKGYRYELPINEMISGIEDRFKDSIFLEDIPIFHWGNYGDVDPVMHKAKLNRYIEMYTHHISNPEYSRNAYFNFQLGDTYLVLEDFDAAQKHFARSVRFGKESNAFQWMYYWQYYIKTLLSAQKFQRIFKVVNGLEKRFPFLTKEIYTLTGRTLLSTGNYNMAKTYFYKSLEVQDPTQGKVYNIDTTLRDFDPHFLIGMIEDSIGDKSIALEHLKKAQMYGSHPALDETISRLEKEVGPKC